jgi:hypothetical protein
MIRLIGVNASQNPPELSPRLEAYLEDLLVAQVPNAGRFCGRCYTPLPTGRDVCPACDASTSEVAPLERLPLNNIEVYMARRKREGLAVRLVFYTTLLVGIVASAAMIGLLPYWWNVAAFSIGLGLSYLLSGNLANTLGDAIGYRWGQKAAERKWQQLQHS